MGSEGVVSLDRRTEHPRVIARLDGYLTGPSDGSPEQIALDYLRSHRDLYALSEQDLGTLHLVKRYTSRGKVVHLDFEQRLDGVPVLEGGFAANLTTDGQIINVLGAPVVGLSVPSLTPVLAPSQAQRAAAQAVRAPVANGAGLTEGLPGGQAAELVLYAAQQPPRLAWRVLVDTVDGGVADVVVDARTGDPLRSRDLQQDANAYVFDHYPGAALGGTQRQVNLGSYVTNPGGLQLQGPFARVFADQNDDDVAQTFRGDRAVLRHGLPLPVSTVPERRWRQLSASAVLLLVEPQHAAKLAE